MRGIAAHSTLPITGKSRKSIVDASELRTGAATLPEPSQAPQSRVCVQSPTALVSQPVAEWLVLQCSAAKTLELARSLTDAGFEAWAPITREIARKGENRGREEVAVPLMPSFVFARSTHLYALLALSRSPSLQYRVWDSEQRKMVTKGHPRFRLFRVDRLIPDWQLDPLRRLERKPRPAHIERTFAIGERVRTDDNGFAGLTGTVRAISGKKVSVAFPGWAIEVIFPTWAIRSLDAPEAVNVNAGKPECDAA